MSLKQQEYLLTALQHAQTRRGFCAPNPAVGAVIVKDEQIIGAGFHFACGHPHAEVEALQAAGEAARGATAYVTLEPCRHTGRTPPCTEALIRAGVAKVVYAYEDPNPLMAGQSTALLQAAGIVCEKIAVPAVDDFYQSYKFWWQHKRPFVTAKLALSLDGKIAYADGRPAKITGSDLQNRTFLLRKQADAILTTVRTIIKDDPQLNARLPDGTLAKPLYVLDTRLEFPLAAKVMTSCSTVTLLHGPQVATQRIAELTAQGLRCCSIPLNPAGLLDLQAVLELIGAEGCHDLWVEAGGRCFSALIAEGWANCGIIYLAPKLLGLTALSGLNLSYFPPVKKQQWEIIGDDVLLKLNF